MFDARGWLGYTDGVTGITMQAKPTVKPEQLSLWIYIPLWLFFVYLFIQILGFEQSINTNIFLTGLYFILFGVHEASHIVFIFLPSIITAAAGSLGEIIFAGLIVISAFRAKAFFAGIFGMLWLMLAMTSAGNYMADARVQSMPLVGPGENPQHDWNFVFGQLGWLDMDTTIGAIVRIVGDAIGVAGLCLGLALIVASIIRKAGSVNT